MSIKFFKKANRGFTLVEMLVSSAIFALIATLSISTLYIAQKINIRMQSQRTVIENVAMSMNTITRTVRYSKNLRCSSDMTESERRNKSCPYGSDGSVYGKILYFNRVSPSGSVGTVKEAYYYDPATLSIYYSSDASTPAKLVSNAQKINSDDVKITDMRFYVVGACGVNTDETSGEYAALNECTNYDTIQPTVTIILSGRLTDTSNPSSIYNKFSKLTDARFTMQSTVTISDLDF